MLTQQTEERCLIDPLITNRTIYYDSLTLTRFLTMFHLLINQVIDFY